MNVAQVNAAEPKLLDRVRREIRTRHLSLRTEEAYVGWVRRFILFHGKRHPAQMGGAEVRAFLTHLAVDGKVAASTQNQALSALLFLYRHVLEQELGTVEDVVRARRPTRLPTVFTQAEVNRVLEAMQGTRALMAGLLYGSGLRLLECLRLRVKDVQMDPPQLTVRDGKGQKDRVAILPLKLREPLRLHLKTVRKLHEADVSAGFGDVYLPGALARKYPSAGTSWAWQYVFPAPTRSVDPRSGKEPAGRDGVESGGGSRGASLSATMQRLLDRAKHYWETLYVSSDLRCCCRTSGTCCLHTSRG